MIRLVRVPFVNVASWALARAEAGAQLDTMGSYFTIKAMFLFGLPASAMDSVCVRVCGREILYVHATAGCDESPAMSGGQLMGLTAELEGMRPGQIPLPPLDGGHFARGSKDLGVSVKLSDLPKGAKAMDLILMVAWP